MQIARWPLLAEETGGEGSTGGTGEGMSGSEGASSTDASSGGESLLNEGGTSLLDWRHGMAETVREAAIVKRHNTPEAAAKTLIEQERLLGRSIQLPQGEKGTDDYNAAVQKYQATLRKHDASLAMPDKAEDYVLNAPEGKTFDEAFAADWRRDLYDAGMTQGQADKVMAAYWRLVDKAENLKAAQAEVSKVEGKKALQAEFGASTNIMLAKFRAAFKHLGAGMFNGEGGAKAAEALESARDEQGNLLMNNPHVVAAMAGIIDRLGEAEFLDSGDYVQGQSTLEAYQKEFDDLQAKRMAGTQTPKEAERQAQLAQRLSRPSANGQQRSAFRQTEVHMVGGQLV